jgi:outer membrane protein TolC
VPVELPVATAPPAADPYRLGTFTEQGTITPEEVRLLALRNNKDIAVVGLAPEVAEPLIDAESAVFDPVFNIALNGGRYNQQTSSQVQALGEDIPVLKTAFWLPNDRLNQTYFEKLFVTGGKLQAGLGQTYYNYSPAGDFVFINPAYQASFNATLEQPLFRGRGPAATTAPIRIAKANHEQSWYAFRATVNQVLRDAEAAYWDVYAAYQDDEVRDLSYRQAMETWEREQGRLQIGEGSVPDAALAEEQATAFHIARTDAENRLIAAQRNLRRLLGLAPGDPRPLVPATSPAEATVNLDWDHAASTALSRPEIAAQRAAVEAVEVEMARRLNGLQPDLSVQAIYTATGLDSDFGTAWATAGEFQYNSWTAGVVYKQPLGRRNDRALADRAAAALALESARLRQVEHEILHQLDGAFQNVQAMQRILELNRRRREAAALQLTARRELYLDNRASLRDQLDAEIRYASALYEESLATVNYQRALTDWNYARGAIGEGDVVFAE